MKKFKKLFNLALVNLLLAINVVSAEKPNPNTFTEQKHKQFHVTLNKNYSTEHQVTKPAVFKGGDVIWSMQDNSGSFSSPEQKQYLASVSSTLLRSLRSEPGTTMVTNEFGSQYKNNKYVRIYNYADESYISTDEVLGMKNLNVYPLFIKDGQALGVNKYDSESLSKVTLIVHTDIAAARVSQNMLYDSLKGLKDDLNPTGFIKAGDYQVARKPAQRLNELSPAVKQFKKVIFIIYNQTETIEESGNLEKAVLPKNASVIFIPTDKSLNADEVARKILAEAVVEKTKPDVNFSIESSDPNFALTSVNFAINDQQIPPTNFTRGNSYSMSKSNLDLNRSDKLHMNFDYIYTNSKTPRPSKAIEVNAKIRIGDEEVLSQTFSIKDPGSKAIQNIRMDFKDLDTSTLLETKQYSGYVGEKAPYPSDIIAKYTEKGYLLEKDAPKDSDLNYEENTSPKVLTFNFKPDTISKEETYEDSRTISFETQAGQKLKDDIVQNIRITRTNKLNKVNNQVVENGTWSSATFNKVVAPEIKDYEVVGAREIASLTISSPRLNKNTNHKIIYQPIKKVVKNNASTQTEQPNKKDSSTQVEKLSKKDSATQVEKPTTSTIVTQTNPSTTTTTKPKPQPKKVSNQVINHNPNWQQALRKHNEFINKTNTKTSLPNTGYKNIKILGLPLLAMGLVLFLKRNSKA